jgi:membrane protease YdiL (CAAX protease family)
MVMPSNMSIMEVVMKSFFNGKDLSLSGILAAIGLVAGLAISSYQIPLLAAEIRETLLTQLGSETVAILVSAFQVALLTFLTTFFGLKMARATGLELQWWPPKTAWLPIVVIAILSALVIGLSDLLFFSPYLPESVTDYQFSWLYLVSSVLYGGIIEEILLRLFAMSLLVFLAKILFWRKSAAQDLPPGVFILAIFLSAALFAAGHLPATAQLLGLSFPIVLRAFLLNGLAGLGFGWLYWKHGLGSAMAAHILTHLVLQLILLPLARTSHEWP